jgi:hypothetical protein
VFVQIVLEFRFYKEMLFRAKVACSIQYLVTVQNVRFPSGRELKFGWLKAARHSCSPARKFDPSLMAIGQRGPSIGIFTVEGRLRCASVGVMPK